jgi:hypothetical protein
MALDLAQEADVMGAGALLSIEPLRPVAERN